MAVAIGEVRGERAGVGVEGVLVRLPREAEPRAPAARRRRGRGRRRAGAPRRAPRPDRGRRARRRRRPRTRRSRSARAGRAASGESPERSTPSGRKTRWATCSVAGGSFFVASCFLLASGSSPPRGSTFKNACPAGCIRALATAPGDRAERDVTAGALRTNGPSPSPPPSLQTRKVRSGGPAPPRAWLRPRAGSEAPKNKKPRPVGPGRFEWAQQGSNLRPLPCEGSALPLSYAPVPLAKGGGESAIRRPTLSTAITGCHASSERGRASRRARAAAA